MAMNEWKPTNNIRWLMTKSWTPQSIPFSNGQFIALQQKWSKVSYKNFRFVTEFEWREVPLIANVIGTEIEMELTCE